MSVFSLHHEPCSTEPFIQFQTQLTKRFLSLDQTYLTERWWLRTIIKIPYLSSPEQLLSSGRDTLSISNVWTYRSRLHHQYQALFLGIWYIQKVAENLPTLLKLLDNSCNLTSIRSHVSLLQEDMSHLTWIIQPSSLPPPGKVYPTKHCSSKSLPCSWNLTPLSLRSKPDLISRERSEHKTHPADTNKDPFRVDVGFFGVSSEYRRLSTHGGASYSSIATI